MIRYLTLKVKYTYKYASLSLWGNPTSNTISKHSPPMGFLDSPPPPTHPLLHNTHATNQNQLSR